jgi:HD-GYP domain-containing protein (c-di-GMP phosphodiesterase class II)
LKKPLKKRKQKQVDNVLLLPIPAAIQREQEKFAEEVYPDVLIEALRSIVSSLEEKDSYTHGHSFRVAEYAVMLSEEMKLSELEIREVELSALLHDVGKIGIPDSILLKPGRLTTSEFEIMKSHPVRSGKILEKISALRNLIPGIVHHHERFDGLGYPHGLKGEEIPLYARIILIADTYDAMTSTRPYRLALDKEVAFEELKRCSSTQFDPYLVQCFIQVVRRLDHGDIRRERDSIVKKIA